MNGNGIKHSIAIASGKGGVGKSTVSVNLAVALAQAGSRDGVAGRGHLWAQHSHDDRGPSDAPDQRPARWSPWRRTALRLMSLGFLMPDGTPTVWRGPMVAGAIQQFLRDVEWGALDYLVIDLPPGTGDAQLTLAQSLPLAGAVIVMTPQDVADADRQQGRGDVSAAQGAHPGDPGEHERVRLSRIAGPRAAIFKQGGGRRASELLGVPLLAEIPLDPVVCQASDRGEPIATAHPGSPMAKAFRGAAEALAARIDAEAASGPVIRMKSARPIALSSRNTTSAASIGSRGHDAKCS